MHLLAFSVLLGFGHMFCMAGHQMLAVRPGARAAGRTCSAITWSRPRSDRGSGRSSSAGSAARPRCLRPGIFSPSALSPPRPACCVAVLIRPDRRTARQHDPGDFVPIGQLLKLHGFAAVMVSSVVTVTALDLLVIYLPALGAERQIDSSHIGLLLTVRSVASLVSRVFYARLIYAIGRMPLTLTSMLASAAGFLVLAIPLSLPAMYGVLVALGFAMGIASTLTISGVVHLAPPRPPAPRSRCG